MLQDSNLLTDGATETLKHEMKKQKGGFLGVMMAPMSSSLIQPVASSMMNAVTGKGVTRARKRQENRLRPLLTSSLKMKVLGKVTSHKSRKWILEHSS